MAVTIGSSVWLFVQEQRDLQRLRDETARQHEEAIQKEAEQRASAVASFGEACRDYTSKVLSPAVEKQAPGSMGA